jgi:HPt (histidine-containing phosphotransfer) domain-containing protein
MSELRITVNIDPDLEELIPGFLDNRSKDLQALRTALSASDFKTVQSLGHGLKGVGGGYGFDRISELGSKIETAVKSGALDTLPGLIDELADYLDRVEVKFE